MNENTLTVIGIAMFAFCIIAASALNHFIRTRHPALWDELGRPGMIKNNTPETSWRISQYVLGRKYRDLSDKRLIRIFDVLRVLQLLGLASFALFCISFIVAALQRSGH